MSEHAAPLADGLDELGLTLQPEQQQQLLAYLALLLKWNRVYNLTAVRDPRAMVSRHLLDSLTVLPFIGDGPLLDVGSGAGLPAIPLAIARPGLAVTALDSNSKKTRFITQTKLELGLDNVEVIQTRVAGLDRPDHYGQVVSRAFSSIADFAAAAGPWCRPDGSLLAMKGRLDPGELEGLGDDYRIVDQQQLKVPGLASARSVVIIRRA